MNSTSKETIKPSAETYLNKLYLDLYHLVHSVEKGSGSELTVRLRNVESNIAHFKETLKAIPDIGVEEGKQRKKIAALYKQIEKKDELLESLASFSLDGKAKLYQQPSASQPQENNVVEARTNESTLICKICQTVVILKNMTTEWLNEERELPLPRQTKGIDYTQTEPVKGYFGVKDIFAFENVGFTRSSEGKRFLVCGECEQGPVGFVDPKTEMNYITPERLDVLETF